MKDLLDKLSSYNIFNYLFPGILFSIFVDSLTSFHIAQKNLVTGVFLYYFLGSLVSRVGSLFVEPLFRKSNLMDFASYDDFIKASKVDQKIELLLEVNNMYRTICALMVSVAAVVLYARAATYCPALKAAIHWVVIIGIFALYLLSYRKQTNYIVKRIKANIT